MQEFGRLGKCILAVFDFMLSRHAIHSSCVHRTHTHTHTMTNICITVQLKWSLKTRKQYYKKYKYTKKDEPWQSERMRTIAQHMLGYATVSHAPCGAFV